ncbi:hypothetical protein ILUMI_05969 [Ignelater luminosus]|uniref:Nose resistant-to-fluoxetine protein N-terminal domain-containing protein n=1 Tax=Ignelater luminosus TaxID=2038154 RepID=A0A8K0DC15_IGNLU|nr:hypothetical protein ILUMI_05969 [Ignelater luminosus]
MEDRNQVDVEPTDMSDPVLCTKDAINLAKNSKSPYQPDWVEKTEIVTKETVWILPKFKNRKVSLYSELHEPRLIDLPKGTVYLPWGTCLPNTCSAKDFRTLHAFILRFSEDDCQTEASQTRRIDKSDIAAM